MMQLFTHGQRRRAQPRWPRKNGLTSSTSSEEDDPRTVSETCWPASLPTCLVTLRYDLVIYYMASKHKVTGT